MPCPCWPAYHYRWQAARPPQSAALDLAVSAPVARQVMDEEEIFDVRLATFRVFNGESANPPRTQPTIVGAGCGACGIGLYYPQNPPAVGGTVYQTPRPFRPRPTRPANKYRRS